MVDMSYYEKEENFCFMKEFVQYCNECGIFIEVEFGCINGGEDGVVDIGDMEEVFISFEQV